MPSDTRALAARNAHKASLAASASAGQLRAQRDSIVRRLRAEDPGQWTYAALAGAVGCSPELIAHIVKHTVEEPPQP